MNAVAARRYWKSSRNNIGKNWSSSYSTLNPFKRPSTRRISKRNPIPLSVSAESILTFSQRITFNVVPKGPTLHYTSNSIPTMNGTMPRGIILSERANESLDTSICSRAQSVTWTTSFRQSIRVQRHIHCRLLMKTQRSNFSSLTIII